MHGAHDQDQVGMVDGEEEPYYAYVYDYEDDEDQIWSDCSKLADQLMNNTSTCNQYK